MTLEDVRKRYVEGRLFEFEAIQYIESLGETRAFAQKYLRGFTEEAARVSTNAGHANLLVLPR